MEGKDIQEYVGKTVTYNQGQGVVQGVVVETDGLRLVIDNGRAKVKRLPSKVTVAP